MFRDSEKVSLTETEDDDDGNDRDGGIVIRVRTNSILGYQPQNLVMLDIHNDQTGQGETPNAHVSGTEMMFFELVKGWDGYFYVHDNVLFWVFLAHLKKKIPKSKCI